MKVDVSGRHFVFPNTCACCSGNADTELEVSASKSTGERVVHTSTNVWDIPYCHQCTKHVKCFEEAAGLASTLSLLAFAGAGAFWFFKGTFLVSLVILALLIGVVCLIWIRSTAKARAMCNPDCVCVENAVQYLSWHGTHHKFCFTSQDYALAFMVANQKKLVNVSPEAHDLLKSRGHVPTPNVPRAPRRFKS